MFGFDLDRVIQMRLGFARRAQQAVPETVQGDPSGGWPDVERISASITGRISVGKQGAAMEGHLNVANQMNQPGQIRSSDRQTFCLADFLWPG
jgi:hypothetical protein